MYLLATCDGCPKFVRSLSGFARDRLNYSEFRELLSKIKPGPGQITRHRDDERRERVRGTFESRKPLQIEQPDHSRPQIDAVESR